MVNEIVRMELDCGGNNHHCLPTVDGKTHASAGVPLLYPVTAYSALSENGPIGRQTTECLFGQTKRGRR